MDKLMTMCQRMADEWGEDVLVLLESDPTFAFRSSIPYGTFLKDASKWEKKNAVAVVHPNKDQTR